MFSFTIGGCIILKGKSRKLIFILPFSNIILFTKKINVRFKYLHHLKKMIRSKACVKSSVRSSYIIEKGAKFLQLLIRVGRSNWKYIHWSE